MADLERGRRLAEAATNVIAVARHVVDRRMPATDDCSVVLTRDVDDLAAALTRFDDETRA